MKRLLALLIGSVLCAVVSAQSTAPATDSATSKAERNKAKQQMVKGTTEADATQSSVAPYKGKASPSSREKKMTAQERKESMEGASKTGAYQAGPAAGQQAATANRNAPKAAKPDMSDPKVREAMQKQKQ